ncbi:hypothetical protein Bhyg_12157 [Pseudolycoriella hygida]|uniref:Uncharacterized protein n=1 Tax=Pseudolycoriella hygida TaxID=35572 RepID=A0A9Q0MWU8_9DIPT|nr:hypothetical protein Bhyg_12157 [Pseudolycoriella hygida]
MTNRFKFLCGNFGNKKFIYATKFGEHPWHYFNDEHTIITQHDSLPSELEDVITTFKTVRTVEIWLDDDQVKNYYDNRKFIFKNRDLKTFTKSTNRPKTQNMKTTRKLIFNSLETSPLLFLEEYEKCSDLKTDRDNV